MMNIDFGGVRNSAVASRPCPLGHITRCMQFATLTQIPSRRLGTSHTPKTLAKMPLAPLAFFGRSAPSEHFG
ncbi:MAG: hypothetical protein QMD22_11325 [archaeon]|nr:hypothetical protein [archaeon]